MIVIMGTAALSLAAGALATTCGPYAPRYTQTGGVTIALWTIPTAASGTLTTGTYVYGPADQGAHLTGSNLRGVHASATSVYSSPAGLAPTAPFALSSNGWALNDYYEVTASTQGFPGVTLQWDQYRSSTGPSTFRVDMSIDGGATFTTVLDTYTLASASWMGGSKIIASIPNAGNKASVMFRFIDTMATGASTGTCRIDNILIRSDVDAPPPLDTDGDGYPDSTDNCPTIANPLQADCNNNGVGDVCEIAAGAPDFNADTIPDTCQCLADLFIDRQVDGADLGVLLAFRGPVNPALPSADINRDGLVNGADLGYLLNAWGPCTN